MEKRVIKFRAFGNGKMIYEDIINIKKPIDRVHNFFSNVLDDYSVMQFTGFKDKNGKDIYEGDQLHIPGYYCTVIFENGSFKSVYEHPEDGETLCLEDLGTETFTIIGNIYENQELLKP